MITVTTTATSEVEGFRIKDPLEQKLMANLNDFQKAQAIGDFLQTYLSIAVAITDGIPIDQAQVYVISNTERVS